MSQTQWSKASEDVLKLAADLIDLYRPVLKGAKIGFAFRSKAATSKGRRVYARALKVTPKYYPFLNEQLDFIIWIVKPNWNMLEPYQKKGLLLHELCHLGFDSITEKWYLAPHDIEEFNLVISTIGLWDDSLQRTAHVIQPKLDGLRDPEHEGTLKAIGALPHD